MVKEMDKLILTQAANEIEMERKQVKDMRQKTLAQKKQRDTMLNEAKQKREFDFNDARRKELEEVSQLKQAIEKEKHDKWEKKMKGR